MPKDNRSSLQRKKKKDGEEERKRKVCKSLWGFFCPPKDHTLWVSTPPFNNGYEPMWRKSMREGVRERVKAFKVIQTRIQIFRCQSIAFQIEGLGFYTLCSFIFTTFPSSVFSS